MEALDIIKSILEFSMKRTEYSEEVESLTNTVRTLQKVMGDLSDIKLDKEQLELLRFQLKEAKEVLTNAQKSSNGMYAILADTKH